MTRPVRLWFLCAGLALFQTPKLVVLLLRAGREAAAEARDRINQHTAATIAALTACPP